MTAPVPESPEVREQHARNLMHLFDVWTALYRDGGAGAVAGSDALDTLEAMPRTDLVLLVVGGVCALGAAQRALLDMDPALLAAVDAAIREAQR